MDTERNILFIFWFVCVTSVYFLVPRSKAHEFVICFLACQAVKWPVELFLVQFHFIAFPLREFPKASDLNITAKLVWTPVVSGLYFIYKPRVSRLAGIVSFVAWVCLLTLIDALLAAYTSLVHYVRYHWSLTALESAVVLFSVNRIVTWFFKERTVFRKEADES